MIFREKDKNHPFASILNRLFGFEDKQFDRSSNDVFIDQEMIEKDLEEKKANLIHKKNIAIWSGVYYFALVVAYLTVSLTIANSWHWSWLVLAIGIVLSFSFYSFDSMRSRLDKSSPAYWEALINTIVWTLMTITLILFAVFARSTDVWRYLFVAAIPLFALNSVVGYLLKSKGRLFCLLANIMLVSIFLYVSLCMFSVLPWSPSWLIILGGALVDSVVVAIRLTAKK